MGEALRDTCAQRHVLQSQPRMPGDMCQEHQEQIGSTARPQETKLRAYLSFLVLSHLDPNEARRQRSEA